MSLYKATHPLLLILSGIPHSGQHLVGIAYIFYPSLIACLQNIPYLFLSIFLPFISSSIYRCHLLPVCFLLSLHSIFPPTCSYQSVGFFPFAFWGHKAIQYFCHPSSFLLDYCLEPNMTESEKKATSDAEFDESSYWINQWNIGDIRFHREEKHISLEKHLDKFIDGRNGIKIFFPLCGKSVDMKGLADKGHNIVGVDIAEQAFQEFFTDQNLEYTVEELTDNTGKLFTSKDGKIKLYCMDMFKFSKDFEGQFNAIWDRAALVAISPKTRIRYAQVIKGLLSPDCRYMIASVQYDPSLYPGPPYNTTEEDIQNLFGDMCSIEEIEENDLSHRYKEEKVDEVFERIYFLKIR